MDIVWRWESTGAYSSNLSILRTPRFLPVCQQSSMCTHVFARVRESRNEVSVDIVSVPNNYSLLRLPNPVQYFPASQGLHATELEAPAQ
jgi:hypothetical protein